MKDYIRKKRDRRTDAITATRLAKFIAANGISTSKLSRIADVNASYLGDLKSGESEPTRPVMERLRSAAERILGKPVSVHELFDFGGEGRS